MTWEAATDTDDVSFLAAVDWFAQRVPITAGEFERDVEQARRQAFWIAGVTQAEIIRDVHDSLKRALDKGVPFEEWQREIGPTLERAWLGQTIAEGQPARTETILRNWAQNSYARARRQQMDEPAITRLRPYRMFDAVRDERTSEICGACDGTILPADHPWWKTHQVPMHHRCRSGIRALRASKAEALGITENPPNVAAQGDFGTGEEYQGPDRAKFPNKLKPPKPPKPVPPAEPPAQPIKARAGALAKSLAEQPDGAMARDILREQVQRSFPGAVARSQRRNALLVDDKTLSPLGADGYHNWIGQIGITDTSRRHARNAATTLAEGRRASPAMLDRGLRVVVHEELHGHSRMTQSGYVGVGRILEETGTELAARKVMADLLGDAASLYAPTISGTYQNYIDTVSAIVANETGDTVQQAIDRLIRAHQAFIGPGEAILDPDSYLEEWSRGLDVTEPQRRRILYEVRQYAATNPK